MNATQHKGPQFTATKSEFELIRAVARRMAKMCEADSIEFDMRDTLMDLEACHCGGNPIDFPKLLAADDANFGHDVFGIRRFLNRQTGELTQCFSPRCSLPERRAA